MNSRRVFLQEPSPVQDALNKFLLRKMLLWTRKSLYMTYLGNKSGLLGLQGRISMSPKDIKDMTGAVIFKAVHEKATIYVRVFL